MKEELLDDYNFWEWSLMSDEKLFKTIKKSSNKRRNVLWDDTWITPLGHALLQGRPNLTGLLLKYGVPVNDVCDKTPQQYRRPIEIVANKSHYAFAYWELTNLVLRRNPSIDFTLSTGESFCKRYGNNKNLVEYIRKKRVQALAFCLKNMGGIWPDFWWIIKDYLLL
jgi:hypothetical protein